MNRYVVLEKLLRPRCQLTRAGSDWGSFFLVTPGADSLEL